LVSQIKDSLNTTERDEMKIAGPTWGLWCGRDEEQEYGKEVTAIIGVHLSYSAIFYRAKK